MLGDECGDRARDWKGLSSAGCLRLEEGLVRLDLNLCLHSKHSSFVLMTCLFGVTYGRETNATKLFSATVQD